MKPNQVLFLLFAALTACASQSSARPDPNPPQIPPAIPLWPAVAPGSEGQTAPETVTTRSEPARDGHPAFSFRMVSNVNTPSITPFLPQFATGAAVVILPGGGHQFLAIDHEGYAVGQYLAHHGVAGFVVKYRLAKAQGSPYKVDVHELMDVQRAIRFVRSHASEWHIDPNKIGIMGFSAGGELALKASTRFDNPVPGTNDPTDQLSCRPDFQALIYPGGLNDPDSVPLPPGTPPAFLCCSSTDRPTISENLPKLYLRLKAANIPAELHIFNGGGHGFGIRPTTQPVQHWPDLFINWLRDRGLITGD